LYRGAALDAGLVLLRKVPVSPRELAVELAVAAQVFGAYLFWMRGGSDPEEGEERNGVKI
jgi:hypothetical protein